MSMIEKYRYRSKRKLLLRLSAGVSMIIAIICFALSTPFLILAMSFIGLAYCLLILTRDI